MIEKSIFKRRIHITFNCEEDIAITKPIINSRPHKIYYFIAYIKNTGQQDINMNFFEKNINTLKKSLGTIEIIKLEVDYADHIELVQEISKIIKNERKIQKNCEIFINALVPVPAIAGYIAHGSWKNCHLFFDYGEVYSNKGGEARQRGRLFFEFPFTFPFKQANTNCIKVLKIINKYIKLRPYNKYHEKPLKNGFMYKKDLIKELIKRNFIIPNPKQNDAKKEKSRQYKLLEHRYLHELKDLNCIKISKDKLNKKINITKKGKYILEIYKYLTPDND